LVHRKQREAKRVIGKSDSLILRGQILVPMDLLTPLFVSRNVIKRKYAL